jgi:diaminohydroxyphosphoribosylaminopyrimidine deaminase/5-amino-6-(5-phosphoribosylamino)uracil reductase
MTDEDYMSRAIELARARVGLTGDNPAVGCVIVRDGRIVGEGVTGEGGRPHGEEVALAQAGDLARGATAYVTLEPCAQRSGGGRSCSELLAAAGVVRVAVGADDASVFADGQGVQRLRSARRRIRCMRPIVPPRVWKVGVNLRSLTWFTQPLP